MGIIFDVFEWFESESRKNEEITLQSTLSNHIKQENAFKKVEFE